MTNALIVSFPCSSTHIRTIHSLNTPRHAVIKDKTTTTVDLNYFRLGIKAHEMKSFVQFAVLLLLQDIK